VSLEAGGGIPYRPNPAATLHVIIIIISQRYIVKRSAIEITCPPVRPSVRLSVCLCVMRVCCA